MKAQIWEIENAIKYVHLQELAIAIAPGVGETRPQALALWHQKVIDELSRLAESPDEWPAIFRHLDTCQPDDVRQAIQNLIDQNQESKDYVNDEANWQ